MAAGPLTPSTTCPARDLGYTRYDKMAETLGCYAEYIEEAEAIRPRHKKGAPASAPFVVSSRLTTANSCPGAAALRTP
jgi:hypothetical protein